MDVSACEHITARRAKRPYPGRDAVGVVGALMQERPAFQAPVGSGAALPVGSNPGCHAGTIQWLVGDQRGHQFHLRRHIALGKLTSFSVDDLVAEIAEQARSSRWKRRTCCARPSSGSRHWNG
jgi:hypothetical protein